MQYNASHPNQYIRYLHINYPLNTPYFLSLNMLTNLNVHDGSNYIEWLAEKLLLAHTQTERPPSVIFFSFQITAKLVYEVPKAIQQLTVTSPVFCVETQKFQLRFYNALLGWLDELRSKTGSDEYSRWFTDGYHAYHITELKVLHFTQFKSGGCVAQRISKTLRDFLYCPETRDNYCFFAVLLDYDYFKAKVDHLNDYTQKLEYLREHEAQLPLDLNPVWFKDLPKIVQNLQIQINMYTEEEERNTTIPYKNYFKLKDENIYISDQNNILVNMLWIKRNGLGHFYGVKDLNILDHVSCRICYSWFYKDTNLWNSHIANCKRCPTCKVHMGPSHKCRKNRKRKNPKEDSVKKKKNVDWDKDVWFADFETYTKGDGTQHVYCTAIVSLTYLEKYQTEDIQLNDVFCERFWGDQSIELFVHFLLQIKKSITIWFYNGCRFDYSLGL